jgi:peptide/nickel transport system permease protein
MLLFAAGKILQTVMVLLIVSVVCFTLLKLAPGDPIQIMLGTEY